MIFPFSMKESQTMMLNHSLTKKNLIHKAN